MESVTQVEMLVRAVSGSLSAYIFDEGMNPFLLSWYEYIAAQTLLFNLGKETSFEKKKMKPAILCLKINVMLLALRVVEKLD